MEIYKVKIFLHEDSYKELYPKRNILPTMLERELYFGSKDDRDWFFEQSDQWMEVADVGEIIEWSAEYNDDLHELRFDLPPKEFTFNYIFKNFLTGKP